MWAPEVLHRGFGGERLHADERSEKPLPHFFHVAAVVGDMMVVLGGRTETHDFSNHLLLYQLCCNAWVLPPPTEPAVVGEPMNQSVAHAVAGGWVYISGGLQRVALGQLSALRLPVDPCWVLPSPEACNRLGAACAWCQGSCLSAYAASWCLAAAGPPVADWDPWRHPAPLPRGRPQRKWCTSCPKGACIGSGSSCTSENDCRINQREILAAANCSEVSCEASDCPKCTASGKCMWTWQFKRTSETWRILSVQPTYDWTCFSHSLLNVSLMLVESSPPPPPPPPPPCPTPCHNHSSCPLCLASKGVDGGWQHCVWSVSLQQDASAENECPIGHHDCNKTQDCHDVPHGFRCASLKTPD
ncbi:LOW QUALITY PROTEIN: multiple epidermal growth factor-like domains protein 8, partial [Morus bassanus]